jgi:NAD(P)-dependent dehydrogenase (short-subunit alcohol dehydrogenase family)
VSEVIVVIGAGQIGQAIARRVSAGKHVLLADIRQANADAAAEVFANAGFDIAPPQSTSPPVNLCTPSSKLPPPWARSQV